jgi:hypothetical protein
MVGSKKCALSTWILFQKVSHRYIRIDCFYRAHEDSVASFGLKIKVALLPQAFKGVNDKF